MYARILLVVILTFHTVDLWADISVQGYLLNAAYENAASDPSCAIPANCPVGRIYWNTTANEPRVWDGSSWQQILVGSSSVPDPLLLSDGTAAAPTYSFTAQPTTGIYRDPSDSSINFSRAGTRVFKANNLGIVHENTTGASSLTLLSSGQNALVRIRAQGTDGAQDSVLYFGDSANQSIGSIYYDHGTKEMKFNVEATSMFTSKQASYNLGIFNNASTSNLEIQGLGENEFNLYSEGNIRIRADSDNDGGSRIDFDISGSGRLAILKDIGVFAIDGITTGTSGANILRWKVYTGTIGSHADVNFAPAGATIILSCTGVEIPPSANGINRSVPIDKNISSVEWTTPSVNNSCQITSPTGSSISYRVIVYYQ